MSDKKERKVPEDHRRCVHVHDDDSRCRVLKMTGFQFCYFHEPSIKEERLLNSQIGGKTAKKLPPATPVPVMETLEDVRQFTVETLHQVRTGHLEPRTAAVLSSLVAHVLKTLPDVDAGTESVSDKLRGLLNDDISEPREAEETSESMQGDRSGEWGAHPLHSI
jgi:hypothetical protein